MNVFEIVDKTGRQIRLTRERWSHIAIKHSDVSDKIEEIKLALIKPTLLALQKFDNIKANYYRYYKIQKDYLLVGVKCLNGEGYITTAFFTRKITQT